MMGQRASEPLRLFVRRIMNIQPRSYNIVGRNMPGMGGSAGPFEGAFNSGTDVTQTLKQSTYDFAIAIRDHKSKDEIITLAKRVEGCLLNDAVLNVLTDRQSEDLIDELHKIVAPL